MAGLWRISMLLLSLVFLVEAAVIQETTQPPIILNKQLLEDVYNNEWVNHNGLDLYEGDIALTEEEKRLSLERKAIVHLGRRWTLSSGGFPFVPYTIDAAVDRAAVEAGIAHWEENTCIVFEELSGGSTASHLKFIDDGGCYSYVGMQSSSGQDVSIGSGCVRLGTVAHEIGHAIGFYHEQSRTDRDAHVAVFKENVRDGFERNFDTSTDNNYSIQYDHSSNMHYGSRFFTKNGKLTIVATGDPLAQEVIGQRTGLSFYDKLLANTMYPCIEKWMESCGITINPCQNNGYVGADCECVCPSGTSGTLCGTVDGDYYAHLRSGCSEEITNEGTVSSTNYPAPYEKDQQCVKLITAPECKKVRIAFTAFQIYEKTTHCNGQLCCYFEILEIRTDDIKQPGEVYCGTGIQSGNAFNSTGNQLLLYFETRSNSNPGWSAEVTFIPDSTCTNPITEAPPPPPPPITEAPPPPPPPTTPTPQHGDCILNTVSNTVFHWSSSNFGNHYNNLEDCQLVSSSDTPAWAKVTFNAFNLANNDMVTISKPNSFPDLSFSGTKSGTIKLPSYNFVSSFTSDASVTNTGFNITVEAKPSKCHKLIQATAIGDTGVLKPPTNNKIWEAKACEWWIRSPSGTRIQLIFKKMKLPAQCWKASVIVNGNGNPNYPTSSSTRSCGKTIPSPMTSVANELDVLFFTKNIKSNFKAKWKVVA